MSAHHLTIAKASFAAGLLRPDITKVGRDDLTAFHSLLEAAVITCTARNIQKCKEWIVANVATSAARTAALGKYFSSFTKHIQQDPGVDANEKNTSVSRKKLHIIYIINDVVHHTKYHTSNLSAFSTFTATIQPFLVELVQSVASDQRPRIVGRLHILFDVWETERFYSQEYVNKLRRAIADFSTPEQEVFDKDTARATVYNEKNEHLFVMPSTHGDPSTPYYDLPAGNLLPFLEPGSSAPIRTDQIKPIQFTAGPADKPLVNALQDFLKDVESIEHRVKRVDDEIDATEIDELGQMTIRDEAGGVTGDTYYGWSRVFCEKMKRRRKGLYDEIVRGRSLSRGSSQSSSPSPRKRRRYSDSERSRSPSRSRSRSPPRFRAASPRKVEHEQTPPQALRAFTNGFQSRDSLPLALPGSLPSVPQQFLVPLLGPNGLPIPPPRPPNWTGPWPPPPPPNADIGGSMPFPSRLMNRGSNYPPPPPPPPGYPSPYGSSYR